METNDLQKEWRQIVLSKLDVLEKSQKSIEDKLVDFAMTSVKVVDYQRLEDRVRLLEDTKIKALGAWAAVQGITVLVAWFISNMFKG